MWRRLPLVHFSRTGQGPQAVLAQETTIASGSCWGQGGQGQGPGWCGQGAWRGCVRVLGDVALGPAPAMVAFDAVPGIEVVRGDQPISARRESVPVWGLLPPSHLLPARGGVDVTVELLDPDPS